MILSILSGIISLLERLVAKRSESERAISALADRLHALESAARA